MRLSTSHLHLCSIARCSYNTCDSPLLSWFCEFFSRHKKLLKCIGCVTAMKEITAEITNGDFYRWKWICSRCCLTVYFLITQTFCLGMSIYLNKKVNGHEWFWSLHVKHWELHPNLRVFGCKILYPIQTKQKRILKMELMKLKIYYGEWGRKD